MIRIETDHGWWLIGHQDHARLAGALAERWRSPALPPPEPRAEILAAVARHDDAWAERDAEPQLTREGLPSAFSKELVGTYDAFEEIDFHDYLKVRGRATEVVAADAPFAAILVSMHTVNLLTEQADLSSLSADEQGFHAQFIADQQARQEALMAGLERDRRLAPFTSRQDRQRAFEFLQACDSFSLMACVQFDRTLPLRHLHPTADGRLVAIQCAPLGDHTYRLSPNPLDAAEVTFELPARFVEGKRFEDLATFQAAFREAPVEMLKIRVVS